MEKKLIRVFIAIEFPDEVIKEVARIQGCLKNWKFTGKMTELENLHLTLKFLGEIDENKLEGVKVKLREINFEGFEAKLGKIGAFHYKGNPKIVWIKILGPSIYKLQKKIDAALEDIGFKNEERFMGHLTIARIKYVKDKKGFDNYLTGLKGKEIHFNVGQFLLKKSELKSLGPIYENLEIYN